MQRRIFKLTGLLAGLLIVLAACGSPATEIPPTATIQAAEPTQPDLPEATQPPASEAAPTPAAETAAAPAGDPGLPAILNENLAGLTVLRRDPFDQLDSSVWQFDPAMASASNGTALVTGNKTWSNGLRLQRPILEGQAVLVTLQMAKGTNFGIQLSSGTPGTPEYRSYGFYRPQSVMLSRVYQGMEDIRQDIPLKGELKVHRFNTWYQVLLGVNANGHFFLLIWDPADPTKFNRTHDVLDESWMGKEWTYTIEIRDGTLTLDEALELGFTGIY